MGKRTKNSRRGMSLVEGMISMAVLVIGILGALQGILFASQQNAVAGRLARTTSMGAQIRLGLEAQGRAKLVAGPLANVAVCVPFPATPALVALTDGVAVAGSCIIDVDAYDSAAAPIDRLVGKYDFAADYKAGNGQFRRVAVSLPGTGLNNFAVVVSTPDTGRRIFSKQFVALYDSSPTGNQTGVDL